MAFGRVSDQAYTKPAQAPGYGPASSVERPVIRIVGIFWLASFVPGNKYGKVRPYVARSQSAPQAGSRSMVPVPSELNAKVNSLRIGYTPWTFNDPSAAVAFRSSCSSLAGTPASEAGM